MKASDVIIELQALIDTHGDLDVKIYDCAPWVHKWRNTIVYFCTDSLKEDEELTDFIAFDIA